MTRLFLLLALLVTPARAHDHWIRDGKYMDPVTGQHCCNEHDCKVLTEADVITAVRNDDGSMMVQGFRFLLKQQHKSEDGKWYRCANRCLFKPVEG